MNRKTALSTFLIILLTGLICLSGCGDGSKKTQPQASAEEIVSTRNMGLAFLEDNQLEEAEAAFLDLTRMAPNEALGFANLGLVYLRTGKYAEARDMLSRALEITPEDPDIRFNLATSLKFMGDHDAFIGELEKNIELNPAHLQSLYRLAESFGEHDPATAQKRRHYLEACLDQSPANLVPRLHLLEELLREGRKEEAMEHLQEIRRLFPELPDEAMEQYRQAYSAIEAEADEEALTAVMILHNYLKLTNPYQNGISELKGYEGSSVGVPAFSFSKSLFGSEPTGESILESIRFTDVSLAAGLLVLDGELDAGAAAESHMALGDYNHDGSDDIYLGSYLPGKSAYQTFLFESQMGRFTDRAQELGFRHRDPESFASITDYNNDGWFDILVIEGGQPLLYESVDKGKYEEVSRKAFAGKVKNARKALFFDMDHEGDLDILFLGSGALQLMRNNGDGTFSDWSAQAGLQGDPSGNRDAVFGDFDDDGDIDLLVLGSDGHCMLYSNLREGRFRNITEGSGIADMNKIAVVRTADYNNDGYLDLLCCGDKAGESRLLKNNGRGVFAAADTALPDLDRAADFRTEDAAFFDFDNDGWQDILLAGIPGNPSSKGLCLLHGDGDGSFSEVSRLLPEELMGGRQIGLSDFNNDGDLDIYLIRAGGGLCLLRNDGGNANHHLKVRLRGIRTGSGKNNHYGIGSRIELRAGSHYQMQVVTSPTVVFGLGMRSDVDVVRIVWTNGTPQNIFTPGIEQDLIEEQQLKGSCPFLYAWNGQEFDFVKDVMWRSALGMPMGIMGGEQSYAFAEASEDYHLIPGELLRERDGQYEIRITEELWETIYLDKVELLAVDHPADEEIFVDEHFTPPPYPPLKIHRVKEKIQAVRATNGDGLDVRNELAEKDNIYLNTPPLGRYQGITETSYLVLDPGDVRGPLTLFLNGWIFPTDASINLALSQGDNETVRPPFLQVINQSGEWETVLPMLGFPQGKNKTVIAELDGLYLSDDRRVRIVSEMQIYWDHAFFAPSDPGTEASTGQGELRITRMSPSGADHHYRGFSRMYRKGGSKGPHWFDYSESSDDPKWRDLRGRYTRFGDVGELVREADNMYIIANAGEETSLSFSVSDAAPLPEGWKRDFLIYCVGWVKDGDMNTAEGHRVEPLPYHGMKSYPYSNPSDFPMDARLKAYHEKYNTRSVTGENWRRALIGMQ